MSVTGGESVGLAAPVAAAVDLARVSSVPMTSMQRMEGLRRVSARLERRGRGRALTLGLSLLGTGAVAVAVLSFMRMGSVGDPGTRAISYSIEGGEIGDGGYIRSSGPAGSLLRFDEGTEVRLMAGARGRLSSVDHHGARFAIEEGEAEVKVIPRRDAQWLVDAGPFLITVRGTVFTAAWNGATEQLDLHMKKGLVSVTGPLANGTMAVRAGQHLSVNIKQHEVLLREANDSEVIPEGGIGTAAAPGLAPAARPGAGGDLSSSLSRVRGGAAALRAGASRAPRSWSAALAGGDLDSILRDAERRGFRRAMAEASSEDLAALADAARYRRRNEIARQALLTERARFPRSARSSDAAFLLGRMEEGNARGKGRAREARALEWYDVYLKEAPSGAYSSEALGRKMMAAERVRGALAARQVAEEYLRRFPGGTYAGAARALRHVP
ncbi:MAG: hypothetical protein ABIS92_06290 [Polyangia bacterium]